MTQQQFPLGRRQFLVKSLTAGAGLTLGLYLAGCSREIQAPKSNFHDYPVLRMHAMPRQVEVHIVESAEPPTGVGEPAIAPAVANALSAVTGRRFGRLPLKLSA